MDLYAKVCSYLKNTATLFLFEQNYSSNVGAPFHTIWKIFLGWAGCLTAPLDHCLIVEVRLVSRSIVMTDCVTFSSPFVLNPFIPLFVQSFPCHWLHCRRFPPPCLTQKNYFFSHQMLLHFFSFQRIFDDWGHKKNFMCPWRVALRMTLKYSAVDSNTSTWSLLVQVKPLSASANPTCSSLMTFCVDIFL